MLAIAALTILCSLTSAGARAGVSLESRAPTTNGWFRFYSAGSPALVHEVQSTIDLRTWTPLATIHDGPFLFTDTREAASSAFYRIRSRPRTTQDDGKNLVQPREDPFESAWSGLADEIRWIKFAIVLAEPNRVWFQDSSQYLFHYDWATKRLPACAGMTRAQFDDATLHPASQKVVLGAVLFPTQTGLREYGIQFVGAEPYPRESVACWFANVRAAVSTSVDFQALYIPTVEQSATAEAERTWFASRNIEISRPDRWQSGDASYAPGWAIGRLTWVPGAEIATAYAAGRLLPTDILLTDAVPAEVPYVAGLVSLLPATPNSHVAILARSYGIPFAYLVHENDRALALQRAGGEVALTSYSAGGATKVRLVPITGSIDAATRAALNAAGARPPVVIVPKARYGAYTKETTTLTPADARYFGGKAANAGLLRRTIPSNSPPALAVSFDLWDDFMDQFLPKYGRTLRQEIQNRTQGFSYPANVAQARLLLAGIRDLISKEAAFTADQKQAIIYALAGFDGLRKIRFRSSTNVEDSEQFTGAGLYDSFSGCLADDLDEDTSGPSRCDPDEPGERGVFRAIQRVYASFFNDNAWLERLRAGLDPDAVGMALLVHHSFPDTLEMANGVATIRFQRFGTFKQYSGELVTQTAAISVANPDGGALPEVVSVSKYDTTIFTDVTQHSNLLPLGGTVMTWQTDYTRLGALLIQVVDGYAAMFPAKSSFALDLEYKKIQPGTLEIKQVRELPLAKTGISRTPFLINQPAELRVRQGEFGDVFANHRLKCRLAFETVNTQLALTNVQKGFRTNATFEFLAPNGPERNQVGPSSWPGFTISVGANGLAREQWRSGIAGDDRQFTLATQIPIQVDTTESPLVFASDFQHQLTVKYPSPMPRFDINTGGATSVSEETVVLAPVVRTGPGSLPQQRQAAMTASGITLDIRFYWPEPPQGISAGYTAPLIAWIGTEIRGLTTDPLKLKNDYAQSYHPFHHNFAEEFLFEPAMDPSATPRQLAELKTADVRMLYLAMGFGDPRLVILGWNGKWREVR